MRYFVVLALLLLVPSSAADINVLDTVIVHTGDPGVTAKAGGLQGAAGTQEDPCASTGECDGVVYVGTYVSPGSGCHEGSWICVGTVRAGSISEGPLVEAGCQDAHHTDCIYVSRVGYRSYEDSAWGEDWTYYGSNAGVYVGMSESGNLAVRVGEVEYRQVSQPGTEPNSYLCAYAPTLTCVYFQHTTAPLCMRYSDVNNPYSWNTIVCET